MKNGMKVLIVLLASTQVVFANRGASGARTQAPHMTPARSSNASAQVVVRKIQNSIQENRQHVLGSALAQLPEAYRSADSNAQSALENAPVKLALLDAVTNLDSESVQSLQGDAKKALQNLLSMATSGIDTLAADKQQKLTSIFKDLAANQSGGLSTDAVRKALAQQGVNLEQAAGCQI